MSQHLLIHMKAGTRHELQGLGCNADSRESQGVSSSGKATVNLEEVSIEFGHVRLSHAHHCASHP